jgi:hypothetical protein
LSHDDVALHKGLQAGSAANTYLLMNPVYTAEYVESVSPRHLPPKALHQKVGFHAIQLIRSAFDKATGYNDDMDEKRWLQRMIFLETVAGAAPAADQAPSCCLLASTCVYQCMASSTALQGMYGQQHCPAGPGQQHVLHSTLEAVCCCAGG